MRHGAVLCALLLCLAASHAVQAAVQLDKPLESKLQPLPDVYYIVLDSHTRNDALIEDYTVDNSTYLNEFRELVFTLLIAAEVIMITPRGRWWQH